YIIGPKISGIMVAGGVLSSLVLIPLITMLGAGLTTVFPPETHQLISQMSADDIWDHYIRYIGAGAVTFGGIMTLIKTFPTIISAFRDSFKDLRKKDVDSSKEKLRTERDLPLIYVLIGSVVLIAFMAFIPNVLPSKGGSALLSSIMIVVFGFFFVTVSSRIVGLIGSSSNPISGMTIATLMATSLIFVGIGWSGDAYQPIALVVGSIVCIASANAGATSQDLKTGYILGATPIKQQLGLIIGVLVSTVAIGFTITLLEHNIGIVTKTAAHQHPLPAPQAVLMATIIKGLLSHNLPWGLVLIGMGISAVMELCDVSSLAFAVGAYLPLSSTTPIFVGGVVKWLVDKKNKAKEAESDIGPGALFSSGLIAGGAITGIIISILMGTAAETHADGSSVSIIEWLNNHIGGNVGTWLTKTFGEGIGQWADLWALAVFLLLGYMLYKFATSKQEELK
ncbi:MAG TPA: oligopeptide transporter, OPT family, partial [Bacteroidia bacterium]|nr:oligopeptide transporter, OPT family [Bacteroidia bacterium]